MPIIRVFYPNISSYCTHGLATAMKMSRNVTMVNASRQVEHGIFATLAYGSGGHYMSFNNSSHYSYRQCCLSFSGLLQSAICICSYIHRSRSSVHNPVLGPLDLSVVLGKSHLTHYS